MPARQSARSAEISTPQFLRRLEFGFFSPEFFLAPFHESRLPSISQRENYREILQINFTINQYVCIFVSENKSSINYFVAHRKPTLRIAFHIHNNSVMLIRRRFRRIWALIFAYLVKLAHNERRAWRTGEALSSFPLHNISDTLKWSNDQSD